LALLSPERALLHECSLFIAQADINLAQRRRQISFWQHVLENTPSQGSALVYVDAVRVAAGDKSTVHCLPEVLVPQASCLMCALDVLITNGQV
jgi:hypothetical protein